MKNVLFALLFIPTICFAQNSGTIPTKTFSRLEINALECKIKLMGLALNNDISNEYGSGYDMTKHLNSYVDTLNTKSISRRFFEQNKESLDIILHNFGVGKHDNILFLKTESDFPVSLLKYKSNFNMLILTNLLSPNTYNTLRLNSRERARSIISEIALDLAGSVSRYDFVPLIKYVGCGVCYSVDDFSNKREIGANPEFVFAVFPVNLLKQLRNGNISEDKLIKSSDVFIVENGSNNLKRIELN